MFCDAEKTALFRLTFDSGRGTQAERPYCLPPVRTPSKDHGCRLDALFSAGLGERVRGHSNAQSIAEVGPWKHPVEASRPAVLSEEVVGSG